MPKETKETNLIYTHPLISTDRENLWVIVREVYEYLFQYLSDDRDSPVGKLVFDAYTWGAALDDGTTLVCLAGLWSVRKFGTLPDRFVPSPIYEFIDLLRYPREGRFNIESSLGVTIPSQLRHRLAREVESNADAIWDGNNPYHIQAFLRWLLDRAQLSNPAALL
jgi:hypothetical protein